MIQLKRIYEPTNKDDGYRVLVDRLWPRGVSKEKADLDDWLKDIAPSTELRKWFDHDPQKWSAFKQKYKKEVKANPNCFDKLKRAVKQHKTVTILYGAKDQEHNEAVVLVELLKDDQ